MPPFPRHGPAPLVPPTMTGGLLRSGGLLFVKFGPVVREEAGGEREEEGEPVAASGSWCEGLPLEEGLPFPLPSPPLSPEVTQSELMCFLVVTVTVSFVPTSSATFEVSVIEGSPPFPSSEPSKLFPSPSWLFAAFGVFLGEPFLLRPFISTFMNPACPVTARRAWLLAPVVGVVSASCSRCGGSLV